MPGYQLFASFNCQTQEKTSVTIAGAGGRDQEYLPAETGGLYRLQEDAGAKGPGCRDHRNTRSLALPEHGLRL